MPRISIGGPSQKCQTCQGQGWKWYGSTATWRGGIGGQAMTQDVCDDCWGSGDRDYPGYDIREAEAKHRTSVRQEANEHLARRLGAGLRLEQGQLELAEELEKWSRKRKATREFVNLASILADELRRLAEAGRDWRQKE